MKQVRLGLVGASGLVGQTFLQMMESQSLDLAELRLFASSRSTGKAVSYQGKQIPLQLLEKGCFNGLDIVFFSAGSQVSKDWAPRAVEEGAFAIDNSSAFRQDPEIPLIVPEANGSQLESLSSPCLIANPNCSTIQLVVALKPLLELCGLKSLKVATYQAISGAGASAQKQMLADLQTKPDSGTPSPMQIAYNCLSGIGAMDDEGESEEENKIVFETRRILELENVAISAWCARVPVWNGHSEAVWAEIDKDIDRETLIDHLAQAPGLQLDTALNPPFASPLTVGGRNDVTLTRLHKDRLFPKTWKFWLVADNIRKGAAGNGLQIAEILMNKLQ